MSSSTGTRFGSLVRWALHPGFGTPELQTIGPEGWSVRQADFAFAISTEARTIIEQEGIILLSYQPLQVMWRGTLTIPRAGIGRAGEMKDRREHEADRSSGWRGRFSEHHQPD